MDEHNRKLRQYRILKSDIEKDLPREQLLTNALLAFYGKATYQDLDTAHRYYQRYKYIELTYKNSVLDQLLIDMPIIKKITQDYNNGSYIAAHTAITKMPYERYAEIMNTLGVVYANGQGVPKDDSRACQLLKKAANLGNAWAMVDVGFVFKPAITHPADNRRHRTVYKTLS